MTAYYEPPLYQRTLAVVPGTDWPVQVVVRHRSGTYAIIVELGSGGAILGKHRSLRSAIAAAEQASLTLNPNQHREVA